MTRGQLALSYAFLAAVGAGLLVRALWPQKDGEMRRAKWVMLGSLAVLVLTAALLGWCGK